MSPRTRDDLVQEIARLKESFWTQARAYFNNPMQQEETVQRLRGIIDLVGKLEVELSGL